MNGGSAEWSCLCRKFAEGKLLTKNLSRIWKILVITCTGIHAGMWVYWRAATACHWFVHAAVCKQLWPLDTEICTFLRCKALFDHGNEPLISPIFQLLHVYRNGWAALDVPCVQGWTVIPVCMQTLEYAVTSIQLLPLIVGCMKTPVQNTICLYGVNKP